MQLLRALGRRSRQSASRCFATCCCVHHARPGPPPAVSQGPGCVSVAISCCAPTICRNVGSRANVNLQAQCGLEERRRPHGMATHSAGTHEMNATSLRVCTTRTPTCHRHPRGVRRHQMHSRGTQLDCSKLHAAYHAPSIQYASPVAAAPTAETARNNLVRQGRTCTCAHTCHVHEHVVMCMSCTHVTL